MKDISIQNPNLQNGHTFHLYIIHVNKRLELYNHLKYNNIYAQGLYLRVHLMPYYKTLGFKKGDFINAEYYYNKCLSLPMYPTLTNEEQDFVIKTIITFLENNI